ncbi:MAG TPA: DUF2971 domain-containing protein, partial [Nitrosomonas sp.]|nr:DUF2971 domain-containing protein [Nitrosomonas sp.]
YVLETKDKIKNALLEERLSEPYITSFCTSDKNDHFVKDHGLLSQWRGYGQNGYAIVFDTFTLSELLEQLHEKGKNGLDLYFEDVFYSSDSYSNFTIKFDRDLEIINNFYKDSFNENKDEETRGLDKIYSALVKCACLYKHWGFKEENEVRVIALPQLVDNSQFRAEIAAEELVIPEIPRKHFLRSGVLIPYINLFEDIPPTSGKRLPITRIIVGPTANAEGKKKRVRSVEILLDQYAIEGVSVTASDIPYIA